MAHDLSPEPDPVAVLTALLAGTGIAVRTAGPADEALCNRLFREARGAMIAALPLPPEALEMMLRQQEAAHRSSLAAYDPPPHDLIVRTGDGDVGRLILHRRPSARFGAALHVVEIAVTADRRRDGIARTLLSAVAAVGAERGLPCTAWVALDNAPSLALFRAAGFRAEPHDGGPYLFLVREPAGAGGGRPL